MSGPGRGNAGNGRAEAELLKTQRVELPRGFKPIRGLEFAQCGYRVHVPLAIRVALVATIARKRGLDLRNSVSSGRFLRRLAIMPAAFLNGGLAPRNGCGRSAGLRVRDSW